VQQSIWKKYQEGGIEAITAVKMGHPLISGCKLTPSQESLIIYIITEKSPDEAGLRIYGREKQQPNLYYKNLEYICHCQRSVTICKDGTLQRPKKNYKPGTVRGSG